MDNLNNFPNNKFLVISTVKQSRSAKVQVKDDRKYRMSNSDER